MLVLLIWIGLFTIWFWLIKDEVKDLFSRVFKVNVGAYADGSNIDIGDQDKQGFTAKSISIGARGAEYLVGVLGIIAFFAIGFLFSI